MSVKNKQADPEKGKNIFMTQCSFCHSLSVFYNYLLYINILFFN